MSYFKAKDTPISISAGDPPAAPDSAGGSSQRSRAPRNS